jgi:tetratricopeptide (TPR) repeat protein
MAKSGKKKTRKKKTPSRHRQSKPAAVRPQARLSDLQTAVRDQPDSVSARLALAEYYLAADQHHRIPETLEPIVKLSGRSSPTVQLAVWTRLAYGYVASRQLGEAEQWAEKALHADPDSADSRYLLAYLKLASGEYETAITHGRAYLSILSHLSEENSLVAIFAVTEAHRAQLTNIIGSAYMESGADREAVEYFRRAIDIDGGNCLPYINLARLISNREGPEAAREILQQGLRCCRQVDELRMLEKQIKPRPTVSACLIVKDEEELLPNCLRSIRDWVDEIVVVDTGSTDRTVEIAESFGARVFHQPWEGDFSKHRNYSMSQATSEWIFVIDADEEFLQEDIAKLQPVLRDERFGIVVIDVINVYPDSPANLTFLPSMRLFRRKLNLKYDGIVHNQLVVPEEVPKARLGARLKHYGYGLTPGKMAAKVERSQALLEKQLEENPDSPFAHFNYAQLLRGKSGPIRSEDAKGIIRSAEKVLALVDPDQRKHRHLYLMALDQLAWTHYKLKDYDRSLEFCRRALDLRPDYLDPLHLLGHLYTAREEFDLAEEAFKKYLEIQAAYDPSTEHEPLILMQLDSRAAAYYGLALLAGRTGRTAEEKNWLLKTVDLVPGYLRGSVRLGQIHLENGDLDSAELYFQLQIDRGQECADARLGLGYVFLQQKRFAEAESEYRRALELDPDNLSARRNLARVLSATDRSDLAADLLREAVSLATDDPGSIREMASLQYEAGDYRSAGELLENLLNSGQASAEIANDLANCHFKLGDLDAAETLYRRALELNPGEISAVRNLGLVLARLGRSEEAISTLDRLVDEAPELTEVSRIIGNLYAGQEKWSEALSYLERHLRSVPNDHLALFDLAECYFHMGHTDSARMGYRRVLQIDPEFAPAEQRLTALDAPRNELAAPVVQPGPAR